MIIKNFPQRMDQVPVDLDYPNRTLVWGCFQETTEVNGVKRQFLTYIPEDLEYCQPCIVVAPPSEEDPLAFLERSGLLKLADEKRLLIALMLPQAGGWDFSGQDADFMNAVYVKIQARDYYVTMQDNIYALGVGDGAAVAHQAAQKMASEWSGLMTFGTLAASLNAASGVVNAQEQNGAELKIEGKRSQLPVWMTLPTLNGVHDQEAVSYWRQENHTVGEPLSGDGADMIWFPSPVRMRSEVNEEQIAQVRVTLATVDITYDRLCIVWKYISAARRHRGQGHKILRYYKEPTSCGAVLHQKKVDGMTRSWYEYVPECCTPDKKWPLVLVMHGRGGTAESFFDISCASTVAQERGFIAVFPQAGPFRLKEGGIRNVLRWNGEYMEEPTNDIAFLRELVEDVASRHQIDRGRVYACGQSAGGIMSDCLWWGGSDFITAVACWSGLYNPVKVCYNYPMTAPVIPTMCIFGEHDRFCMLAPEETGSGKFPFRLIPPLERDIEVKLERSGCDPADLQSWSCGPITWYQYPNPQGVPMVTVGIVRDMAHANYPEESWISWDEFLCCFWRDEDGTLYYRGKKVEAPGN